MLGGATAADRPQPAGRGTARMTTLTARADNDRQRDGRRPLETNDKQTE